MRSMGEPAQHLDFVYELEGYVSEVDLFKLAPTLLALGELIQQSNREISPNGPEIAVNVKPFREGSFIVDLTLFHGSNFRQLLDFLTPHSLDQLKTLLEIIGLIGGGAGTVTVGAVKTIRFLRGRPKTVKEVEGGQFRLTTADDRSITVDASTHLLLQNSSVVNNIFKIYSDPLDAQSEVRDIKTSLKGNADTAITVDRSDVPALREYASPSALPEDLRETVKETVHSGVFLNPKRGAFDDDPKDWSFWRGDDVITATLKDKGFLTKLHTGEYRLNRSDLLTVDLLERQKVKGTQVQKPTYEIIRVTNYQKGESDPYLPLVE
jgi:hypothetical protein